jgi:hypothetical protein
MVEIAVKYSDDAEDTLRFEDPVGIEKISLALYKCFNRRGVDVVSATSSVVSGKTLVFTANDDGDVLLNGKEPDDDMILVAVDEPIYLLVTIVEGGIQNQQKRKIADPGQQVPMDKLLIQILKYFNKRSVQVQEVRVVITEKQDIFFSLSEDGEILVNGQMPEEGLQFTSSYEPPPPPAPAKIIQAPIYQSAQPNTQTHTVATQIQPAQEIAEMHRQIEEMKAKMLELQRGNVASSGIVAPSAGEVQEFGGIAARDTIAVSVQGGGRRPKNVLPGSPIASYAAEYDLFDPNDQELANGITAICYPRHIKMLEYNPLGADGDMKHLVPRGTRLQAVFLAVHKGGDSTWMLRDPRTNREYIIPDVCLVAPMDKNANNYGDFEHAPLDHIGYMPDKQDGNITGTITTPDGSQPVYDKIALENLDYQAAAVTRMPGRGKMSIEDMAIAQVEKNQGPSISRDRGSQSGKRPAIKIVGGSKHSLTGGMGEN